MLENPFVSPRDARHSVLVRCACGHQLVATLPLVLEAQSTALERLLEQRAAATIVCDRCQVSTPIEAPFAVMTTDDDALLVLPESSRWRELEELIVFLQKLDAAHVACSPALLRPRLCFGTRELAAVLAGGVTRPKTGPLSAPLAPLAPLSSTALPSAGSPPSATPASAVRAQSDAPTDATLSASRAVFASLSSVGDPAPTDRMERLTPMERVTDRADRTEPGPLATADEAADRDGDGDDASHEPATAIHRALPTAPPTGEARFAQAAARGALYLDGEEPVACAIAPMPTTDPLEARVELCNLPTYSLLLVTLGHAPLRAGTLGLFRIPLDPEDGRTEPTLHALDAFASLRVSFFDESRQLLHTATATLRPGQRLAELIARAHEQNEKLPHGGKSFDRAVEVLNRAVEQKGTTAGSSATRTTAPMGAISDSRSASPPSFRKLSREELPRASTENLVKMLDDSELRVEAAVLLCERRDPVSLPGLCQALGRMPRLEASRVLPAMTGFGAASEPYLIDVLGAKKAYLRQGAALALGQLRTATGTAALCQALLDEPTEIWGEIARALGDAGAQAVMPLGGKIRSASVEERDRIVRALAHIAAGGVRGPVEMLGTSRDSLVADAAKRALSLVAEVQRQDKEVRMGQSEHTVVRGFSHSFYERLDNEVELSPEELEIQDDPSARRVTNKEPRPEPQAPRRATTARSLGAIDDLFDRADRATDRAPARLDDRRTDPRGHVITSPDDEELDPEPPRSRRGTLPRGVS